MSDILSQALIGVFDGWEGVEYMDNAERAHSDLRRLRWLAADFDTQQRDLANVVVAYLLARRLPVEAQLDVAVALQPVVQQRPGCCVLRLRPFRKARASSTSSA